MRSMIHVGQRREWRSGKRVQSGYCCVMADQNSPPPESLSDDEIARQRDEVVKRMLNTPPQPRTAKIKVSSEAARLKQLPKD